MVAALILGASVVVAQTQGETPTSAISATLGLPSSVESNPTTKAVSGVKAAVANPTTAAVAVVAGVAATNKLANPTIAQLPTGGGDDDDDDERGHDDEDDEGDDD
jgi:hypothetical protein